MWWPPSHRLLPGLCFWALQYRGSPLLSFEALADLVAAPVIVSSPTQALPLWPLLTWLRKHPRVGFIFALTW